MRPDKVQTPPFGDHVRSPWPKDFPDVFVHSTLHDLTGFWCYHLAKKHMDAKRAVAICERFAREQTMNDLYDSTRDINPLPIVVAPARPPGDSKNALSRSFARFVADELGLQTDARIHQTNAVKRDFIKDGYFRVSQSPTFDGEVAEGATYLLADDVFTMGGTLACLRGFIESKGGTVVGMTTIAEREGGDVRISLAKETFDALSAAHDGLLATLVPEWTGHALDCLTEPEGQFLLRQPALDSIRDGFRRAGRG